jgi:DNA replication protein DnaC
MTIKDKKQKEFSDLYLALGKRRATIISATGTGKSHILILILDKIAKDYEKIYIFVNANRLRDVTWKQEFVKWGREDLLEKIDIVNYQTAYKWKHPLGKVFIVADKFCPL